MRDLREYNAAIFGEATGTALSPSGAPSGLPFEARRLDAFEREFLHARANLSAAFASDLALLGGAELGMRVTFRVEDGDDPLRALSELGAAFRAAAERAFGVEVGVTEAEVLLQERFEGREKKDEARREISLVGQTDFAEILGVSHQRVGKMESDRASGKREDFPAPVDHTSGGPQWLAEDAELFARTWRRTPGRPKKARTSTETAPGPAPEAPPEAARDGR